MKSRSRAPPESKTPPPLRSTAPREAPTPARVHPNPSATNTSSREARTVVSPPDTDQPRRKPSSSQAAPAPAQESPSPAEERDPSLLHDFGKLTPAGRRDVLRLAHLLTAVAVLVVLVGAAMCAFVVRQGGRVRVESTRIGSVQVESRPLSRP
jgi:hypothetical protein